MKTKIIKILETTLLTTGMLYILYHFFRFVYGFYIFDDDLMFISALWICSLASCMFFAILFTCCICNIWKKDKRQGE